MGTSIRFPAPLVAVCLFLFPMSILTAGGGKIFIKSSEVPRPSKTPKGVSLITAQNSESAFSVRAAIAEVRLDQESSKGSAGMTGRLNVFRKFVRFDIRGVTPVAQLAHLKVSYSIKEGDSIKTMEDSVRITTGAAAFVVDMAGFEDKFGTEVKSKSSKSKITSTKYIHDEADIVALKVVVTDQTGHALYVAGWPEAPVETVILPERLRPRTFTSLDGRKIKATIAAKGEDTVTLQINGKRFKMELSKLSEPDREFLNGIPSVVMTPQVPSGEKDRIVIWNQHNGKVGDRGSTKANVILFDGQKEVWRKNDVSLNWSKDKDAKTEIETPEMPFNRIRVEITKIRSRGGGLAEVQFFRRGENVARRARVTASGYWERNKEFAPKRVTDGKTSAASKDDGYWLLPNNELGWIQIHLD